MKNLLIAVTLVVLGLQVIPAIAQQTESTQAAAEQVAKDSAAKQGDSVVDKEDGRRIVIDFDAEDETDDIDGIASKLDEIFGETLGAEFSKELKELDDDDLEKLSEAFEGTNIHFGDGDGLGFGEFMIAMTAITFSLGLPVIVLILVLVFGHRKRKQKMELISNYLQADQPVPEHVMAEFGSNSSGNTPFQSGLKFALGGIAFSLAFIIMGDEDIAAIGLIPIAIGAAKLIAWKYDNQRETH